MPCRDDYDGRPAADALKFERMLCAICTTIEHGSNDKDFTPLYAILSSVDWSEAGVERKEFENWWELHKQRDRARRAEEDKKLKQQALIKSAQSKLSAEEWAALKQPGSLSLLPWG
jgi:hypothetical protein